VSKQSLKVTQWLTGK